MFQIMLTLKILIMKNLKYLSILLCLLIFITCTSDNDEDMDPFPDPDPNPAVTYTNTVKGIIDSKCLDCHSNPPKNGAPMSLTTYDNVKDAVNSRGLIGRVQDGSMPPVGDDLTGEQVQAIKDWQTGGFKE